MIGVDFRRSEGGREGGAQADDFVHHSHHKGAGADGGVADADFAQDCVQRGGAFPHIGGERRFVFFLARVRAAQQFLGFADKVRGLYEIVQFGGGDGNFSAV